MTTYTKLSRYTKNSYQIGEKLESLSLPILARITCEPIEKITATLPNILQKEDTLIGIEIEVENIKNTPITHYYWNYGQDGSLRNNGAEFTTEPIPAYKALPALYYLKERIKEEFNIPNFSNRCSTHIHLNVRDLNWEQITNLTLLYAIFEKHFFNVAGTKREENIFCVPLYISNQLNNIVNLKNKISSWSKYNAFNLGPTIGNDYSKPFGTIEFRHLYGTLDTNIILPWINSILKLKHACIREKVDNLVERILNMNSTSEYLLLYKKIFQEEANVTMMSQQDFEYCITTTKLAILNNQEHTFIVPETCALYKAMANTPPQKEFKHLYIINDWMNNTHQLPTQLSTDPVQFTL